MNSILKPITTINVRLYCKSSRVCEFRVILRVILPATAIKTHFDTKISVLHAIVAFNLHSCNLFLFSAQQKHLHMKYTVFLFLLPLALLFLIHVGKLINIK